MTATTFNKAFVGVVISFMAFAMLAKVQTGDISFIIAASVGALLAMFVAGFFATRLTDNPILLPSLAGVLHFAVTALTYFFIR